MSTHVAPMTDWLYRGLWGALTCWFRVPDQPPTLPAPPGETVKSFQPARGFLRYMKLMFWLAMGVWTIFLLIVWAVIMFASITAGLVAIPFAALLILGPGLVGYLAIHLRYDTTWYVMTNRSLRIRRGIWVIRETTITFENVQNVNTNQGPVQRLFGIADLRVDTAGGGSRAHQDQSQSATDHQGLIEGIANPQEIRDAILARLRRSRTTGLGDEDDHSDHPSASQWTPAHLETLREIRDLVQQLNGQ